MRVIRVIGKTAIILSAVAMSLNAPEVQANKKGSGKGRAAELRGIEKGIDSRTEDGRANTARDARAQRSTIDSAQKARGLVRIANELGVQESALQEARNTFRVGEGKDQSGHDALAIVVQSAVRNTSGNVNGYKAAVAEFVNLSASKGNVGKTSVSVAKALEAMKTSQEGVELLQSVISIAKNSKSSSLDAALKEGLKEKGIDVEKFEEFCKI
jgi:hypothetical protein